MLKLEDGIVTTTTFRPFNKLGLYFDRTLNSQLLRKIALDGGGMYAFIPDSGFVGTAFVNSLANILSTITCDAQLSISVDPLSRAR